MVIRIGISRVYDIDRTAGIDDHIDRGNEVLEHRAERRRGAALDVGRKEHPAVGAEGLGHVDHGLAEGVVGHQLTGDIDFAVWRRVEPVGVVDRGKTGALDIEPLRLAPGQRVAVPDPHREHDDVTARFKVEAEHHVAVGSLRRDAVRARHIRLVELPVEVGGA